MSRRYLPKPVPVEAMRFDGTTSSAEEIAAWLEPYEADLAMMPAGPTLHTPLLHIDLDPGMWVIVNDTGTVFAADAEAFGRRYEAVQ